MLGLGQRAQRGPEVLVGQVAERLVRPGRVQEVGGQHRIARDAFQHRAQPAEPALGELGVVADLCRLGVSEPRGQALPNRALESVTVKPVHPRIAGFDGQRQDHGLYPSTRPAVSGARSRAPMDGGAGLDRPAAERCGLPAAGAQPRVNVPGGGQRPDGDRRPAAGRRFPVDAGQQLLELQVAEELPERAPIRFAGRQILQRDRERHVGPDARQLVRQPHLLPRTLEALPAGGGLDLLQPAVERLDAAEALDQLGGGFLADAGHAGDVVDLIAHQRHQVHHLLGPDAVARADRFGIQDRVILLVGVVHQDMAVDELERILVAGHQEHLEAGPGERMRDRGEDVLPLEALLLEDRHAVRRQQRFDQRQLRDERVRHRLALDLVRLELAVAERRLAHVEGHGEVVRPLLLPERLEHAREPVDRVGRSAVRRAEQADGVERPVTEGGAVDQEHLPERHRSQAK